MNDEGGNAVFQETDVANPDAVERMVLRAVGEFGRLDFAHNNAGIAGAGAPIPDYPLDQWYRGIDVMLNGVFLGMRFEIPAILASGGGAIVNTSSGAGLIGFPGMSAYVAAKHGVIGLTKTAALEFGAQGVRINAICPGTAFSRMVDDWLQGDPENLAQVGGAAPDRSHRQPRGDRGGGHLAVLRRGVVHARRRDPRRRRLHRPMTQPVTSSA